MFKISVIGCGDIAMGFHGPAIKKYCGDYPAAESSACCDIDLHKAQKFAGEFGFKAHYNDYREMLHSEKPDVVCLITPYNIISAMAIDIINMGFPVIMEKPPGINREEVIAIIEAVKKNNTANQVAFNRRFTPLVAELKGLLDRLPHPGGIHNIRCVFQRVNRIDQDFHSTAIHGIDTVKYIANSDYKRIRFHYQELPAKGAVNIYMDCLMHSGAFAQFSICPCGGKVIEDYIVTSAGNDFCLKMPVWASAEYPGGLWHFADNKLAAHFDGNDSRYGTEMYEKFGFYAENADFFNYLRATEDRKLTLPPSTVNDISSALQSVEIADCIQKRSPEYISQ